MKVQDIKLSENNIKEILKYFTFDISQFKETFSKLKQYCVYFKFIDLTNEDILFMKNILVDENQYNSTLPIIIYRGIKISDEMFQKIKKKQPKSYTPQKINYSSWSINLKVAKEFSFTIDKGVIFKSTLTSKNKFISIIKYQIICYNLKNYLLDKKTKLTKLENIILDLVTIPIINEEEVLVFDKIKIDKILY